jgi:tRNA nucleotidyltransferase (CCA-adding enzyme)
LATLDAQLRVVLQRYATAWQYTQPSIDGHALKGLGVQPGPQYRRILDELRRAWLDGEVETIEQENQLLERLLKEVAPMEKP